VPVMPSSLLDPVWVQFEALLPARGEFHPDHPLGCHRRRIGDRVVFEHVVAALVHGSGYERIASPGCSDRTIRRRIAGWAAAGLGEAMHAAALAAYEQIVGLDLDDILIDGCITKAVCGGPQTGPSPVDRAKGGIKRSLATEAAGIPIGLLTAPANRHDSPLLGPTLDAAHAQTGHLWPTKPTIHLDAGYDSQITRDLLKERELGHEITWKGFPEPIQNTQRWPCERTHAWMNGYGKLRRITDEQPEVIDFYFYLAATFVTVRALIREARKTHRWDTRPTTRRLK
jgi:DDE family transposase